jgi:hypothetical protein
MEMLMGHGKLKAEDAICTCKGGDHVIDHMPLECSNLNKERNKLRKRISAKGGRWPLNKSDLVLKFTQDSTTFAMK